MTTAALSLAVVLATAPPTEAESVARGRRMEVAGWSVVGAGAAVLVGAITAGVLRRRSDDRVDALYEQRGPTGFSTITLEDVERERAVGERAKIAVAVTFPVAALLATVGTVLIATGRAHRRHPLSLSLRPTRRGVGLTAGMRF